MFKEFREFAMRGNVLDLAVGVIIGAAFGNIVTSLVNDILMPPIGMLTGGIDFKDKFLPLDGKAYESLAKAKEAGGAVLAYGNFINTVVNFLIVALAIFLLVKQVNRFKKRVPTDEAPATKECPYCASSIAAKALRCPHCTSALDRAVPV